MEAVSSTSSLMAHYELCLMSKLRKHYGQYTGTDICIVATTRTRKSINTPLTREGL
jgi:hypothetical protein